MVAGSPLMSPARSREDRAPGSGDGRVVGVVARCRRRREAFLAASRRLDHMPVLPDTGIKRMILWVSAESRPPGLTANSALRESVRRLGPGTGSGNRAGVAICIRHRRCEPTHGTIRSRPARWPRYQHGQERSCGRGLSLRRNGWACRAPSSSEVVRSAANARS